MILRVTGVFVFCTFVLCVFVFGMQFCDALVRDVVLVVR